MTVDEALAPSTIRLGRRASGVHLSVSDLCDELGIARSTFYDWRAARKGPRCIKLPNGQIRIRRADLEAWLEARTDAE